MDTKQKGAKRPNEQLGLESIYYMPLTLHSFIIVL